MKKLLSFVLLVSFGTVLLAQDIQLPQPVRSGGMPLMDALNMRQSHRNFSSTDLDEQTLSNLLWAAYGFNREDKRTVASSQNRQEIDVYVMFNDGVYMYDAKGNLLKQVAKGDHRKGLGGQTFAHEAPVNIICVANLDKASNREAAYIDSGFIIQNIYLFCASEGLGTVTRASFDKDVLKTSLKLKNNQEITITQVIGYLK